MTTDDAGPVGRIQLVQIDRLIVTYVSERDTETDVEPEQEQYHPSETVREREGYRGDNLPCVGLGQASTITADLTPLTEDHPDCSDSNHLYHRLKHPHKSLTVTRA